MVTVTNIRKHVVGDQIKVTATLASISNNDTWVVPHLSKIEDVSATMTTSAAHGETFTGHTITFLNGATLAATISVYGR